MFSSKYFIINIVGVCIARWRIRGTILFLPSARAKIADLLDELCY